MNDVLHVTPSLGNMLNFFPWGTDTGKSAYSAVSGRYSTMLELVQLRILQSAAIMLVRGNCQGYINQPYNTTKLVQQATA